MSNTIVWSKDNCPLCNKAFALLDSKGIDYEVRKIGSEWTREELLEAVPNARTVPQVFLDGVYLGGFTELQNHYTTIEG